MNATEPTIQETVNLLKDAVTLLLKRHRQAAYNEWPSRDAQRLKDIMRQLDPEWEAW